MPRYSWSKAKAQKIASRERARYAREIQDHGFSPSVDDQRLIPIGNTEPTDPQIAAQPVRQPWEKPEAPKQAREGKRPSQPSYPPLSLPLNQVTLQGCLKASGWIDRYYTSVGPGTQRKKYVHKSALRDIFRMANMKTVEPFRRVMVDMNKHALKVLRSLETVQRSISKSRGVDIYLWVSTLVLIARKDKVLLKRAGIGSPYKKVVEEWWGKRV